MNDVDEQKLADRLDRELRGLPLLKAPPSLSPRVLAVIAARQHAPWWKKSWAEWPATMRLVFLAVSLLLAGGIVIAGLQLPQLDGWSELSGLLGETTAGWFAWLDPYVSFAGRVFGTVALVVKSAPPQAMWGLLAIVGLAYATCIGLGTLGYRVAFNRM